MFANQRSLGRWGVVLALLLVGCQPPAEPGQDAALTRAWGSTPTEQATTPRPVARLQRGPRVASITVEPIIKVRIARGLEKVTLDTEMRSPGQVVVWSEQAKTRLTLRTPIALAWRGKRFELLEGSDNGRRYLWPAPTLRIAVVSDTTIRLDGGGEDAGVYPGSLELRGKTDTAQMDVINLAPIEAYLPGVLQRELYASWDPMAYRAQAVAARSYAVFQIEQERQRAMAGDDRGWDVESTVADQAYDGLATSRKAIEAVAATRGVVLTYDASGGARVLPAYYCSSTGGVQQDGATVFQRVEIPDPLRGLGGQGGDLGAAARQSPTAQWGPIDRPLPMLAKRLASWGQASRHKIAQLQGLRTISVAKRTRAGRPTSFTVTDGRGKRFSLTAEELRYAVNFPAAGLARPAADQRIKSSFVTIKVQPGVGGGTVRFTGRGFGHGVGMDQWAAQHMALRGSNWQSILAWHYPGADLAQAW